MNTNRFVDSFDEIRDLSREDQLKILEQARWAAFSQLGLAGQSALYLVLTVVIGFIIAAVATAVTGLVLMPVWVGLSVLGSVLLYQRLMKGLLHKGLASVLKSKN